MASTPASAQVVVWDTESGSNGQAYEFVRETLTWHDARAAAESRQPPRGCGPSYLLSASSANEHRFVGEYFRTDGWMKFTDEAVEGEWRWTNGTQGVWQDPDNFSPPVQTVFTNWGDNEPNYLFGEGYGIFGQKWNDGQITPFANYFVECDNCPASPTPYIRRPIQCAAISIDSLITAFAKCVTGFHESLC